MSERPRTNAVQRRQGRWNQFSVRTLLVSVTILACWLAHEVNLARNKRKAVEYVRNTLDRAVQYDYQFNNGQYQADAPPTTSRWWVKLLGEEYFFDVVNLDLSHTSIDDAGLVHIGELRELRWLWLSHTKVSDRGLEHVANMHHLRNLILGHTDITDLGLASLKLPQKPDLRLLHLRSTRITDDGLAHLEGLSQLETLDVAETRVTRDGLNRLKQALPNCYIVYE